MKNIPRATCRVDGRRLVRNEPGGYYRKSTYRAPFTTDTITPDQSNVYISRTVYYRSFSRPLTRAPTPLITTANTHRHARARATLCQYTHQYYARYVLTYCILSLSLMIYYIIRMLFCNLLSYLGIVVLSCYYGCYMFNISRPLINKIFNLYTPASSTILTITNNPDEQFWSRSEISDKTCCQNRRSASLLTKMQWKKCFCFS